MVISFDAYLAICAMSGSWFYIDVTLSTKSAIIIEIPIHLLSLLLFSIHIKLSQYAWVRYS